MRVLNTPPGAFDVVEGFDHEERRTEVDGVGIASVDVGEGPSVLSMHGEPSWSYDPCISGFCAVPGLVTTTPDDPRQAGHFLQRTPVTSWPRHWWTG
jgi:hypothetical protein